MLINCSETIINNDCVKAFSLTKNLVFTSSSWKNGNDISEPYWLRIKTRNYWSSREWKTLPLTCTLSSDSEYLRRLVFIQLAKNILKAFLFLMTTTITFHQKIRIPMLWSIMSFRLTNFLRYNKLSHFQHLSHIIY